MVKHENLPSSFRDSSGFVFSEDGIVYRHIHHVYKQEYEHLQESGLYQELIEAGLLVSHQEVANSTEQAYKVIRPAQIPFISYPYEWSFSQLKEAALLTLKVQKIAHKYGMTLKDASAYNVQFLGYKPVFIDTLSFERLQEGEPWKAYRQFCQHFLAPLAIMSFSGIPLNKLMLTYLDGIPLLVAATLLPWKAKLNIGLFIHIFMHQKAEQKTAVNNPGDNRKKLSQNSLLHLIDNLEATVKKLVWKQQLTIWGNYYTQTNYSPAALQYKEQLVKEFLTKTEGKIILDIGANNSRFSSIAATFAPVVIAIDTDATAVDQGFLHLKAMNQDSVLPLLVDIINPSPSIGWNNRERSAFFDRVRPDTILALAIIHHLVISNNVPLPMLASFFSANCHYLILEFVPLSDSQLQEMLQERKERHFIYSKEVFEAAFSEKFIILDKKAVLQSERIIYFMQSSKN